jgi:hypothetical protein
MSSITTMAAASRTRIPSVSQANSLATTSTLEPTFPSNPEPMTVPSLVPAFATSRAQWRSAVVHMRPTVAMRRSCIDNNSIPASGVGIDTPKTVPSTPVDGGVTAKQAAPPRGVPR